MSAGEVRAGQVASVTYRLRNLANYPVTVVGAQSTCDCLATRDLPLRIEANGVAEMRLEFATRGAEVGAVVDHPVLLLLDADAPPISLNATAVIIPPDPKETSGTVRKGV